jgi:DNA polymerase-3 subunit gamma/tau
MTLLRMLAFRPESGAQPVKAGRAATAALTDSTAVSASAAAPSASGAAAPEARLTGIDAGNWQSVVEAAGLGGMVRQLALNCVPGSFENSLLTLKLDQAASDRRTRAIEEKLVQGLSKYFGRDIRIVFETAESTLNSPARQRVQAEQDRLARAASAFEADPAVKGLRERFGADVDAASVKPTN